MTSGLIRGDNKRLDDDFVISIHLILTFLLELCMRRVLICSVSAVAVFAALFVANTVADDTKKTDKVDFSKVKCVVNPKAAAKEANVAEYKGGKVYTCCGGCLAKFKKDSSKFATFANHQLVATKQFKQKNARFLAERSMQKKQLKLQESKLLFAVAIAFQK